MDDAVATDVQVCRQLCGALREGRKLVELDFDVCPLRPKLTAMIIDAACAERQAATQMTTLGAEAPLTRRERRPALLNEVLTNVCCSALTNDAY